MRIAVTVLLFSSTLAAAAPPPPLDPEPAVPYRVRVAVRANSHPTLGPSVRQEIAREAAAALRGRFGPAATIDVIDLNTADPADPLLKQFRKGGFKAFDANPTENPDPARVLTGVKTHALTVEYRDGVFHLAARQHDGSTGLASPAVRTKADRSADMLPRLAGMLVEPDFGPVGTVTPIRDQPEKVRLTLRGWQTGPTHLWANVGDVFAVSALVDEIDKSAPAPDRRNPPRVRLAKPIGHTATLLRVTEPPADGVCVCQVLSKYAAGFEFSLPQRSRLPVAGVRAMRLPTVEAAIKLRLVNSDYQPHARASRLAVEASDADFRTRPGPAGQFNLRDGVFQSAGTLNGIACVRVAIGGDRPRLFPVPVLGPEPVTLLFEVKEADEKRAEFATQIRNLRGRIAEAADAQLQLFTRVNKLIDDRKNRAALMEAEGGFGRVQAAYEQLTEDLKPLAADPQAADEGAKRLLEECDVRLKGVAKTQETLTKRVSELKEVAKAAPGGTQELDKEFRARELAERVKEFIARGDVPAALDTYAQMIQLQPDVKQLQDEREKLLQEWTPKDEEHRKARDAVRRWHKATSVEEFADAHDGMTPALAVLGKKRDKYGVRWLLGVLEASLARIQGLVDGVDKDTEEGTKALKDLNKFRELVGKLDEQGRKQLAELVK